MASPSSTALAGSKKATTVDPSGHPELLPGDAQFGPFRIPADSIFYRSNDSAEDDERARECPVNTTTSSTIAFVNLRPIIPGHVLVMPTRVVPLLSHLDDDEYIDLWIAVRQVQAMMQFLNPAWTAFNVAVQDGRGAGQSVPHVHVHILPRRAGDLERNDVIYEHLQEWSPFGIHGSTVAVDNNQKQQQQQQQNDHRLHMVEDADRRDRTAEEMAQEAAQYRQATRDMRSKVQAGKQSPEAGSVDVVEKE